MPKTQLLFFALLLVLTSNAQTLNGKILDAKKSPVIYATVLLQNTIDNTVIKTDISDTNGIYLFQSVNPGNYTISVSAIGYKNAKSNSFIIDSALHNLAMDIHLSADAKDMQTVIITGQKKLVEILADKTVMNIENSILATGSSAFDLLRKAPGVTIDMRENIKMKGQVVQVFIDDKPVFLNTEQLISYLKSLQAEEIGKIELISNPGSKYPAQGTGGIINIKLKKNKNYGTNGSFGCTLGYGRYPKVSGNTSINYRNKKINIFSSVGTGRYESFNLLNLNSAIGKGSTATFQSRDNYWHPVSIYSNAKVGADYGISGKSTIGLLVRGNFSNEKSITSNNSLFTDINNQPQSFIAGVKDAKEQNNNIVFNINYKTDMDSLGSSFNIDTDYGYYRGRSKDVNSNVFNNFGGTLRPEYIFRSSTPIKVAIYSVKTDWIKYLDSSLKVEVGAKVSFVQNNNEIIADSIAAGQWKADKSRSNHFVYTENIYAIYANFNKTFKKLSIQAGVRAEYTSSDGNSVTLNRIDRRNYFDLFPSVFLSYKANEKHTFNLNYSHRIKRPDYQDLNPFIDFIDPYTYFEGNPFLRPSYAHSIEIKHAFNDFLYTSIGYRYANNASDNVIQQNETTRVSLNRTENVGNNQYWSFDINVDFPIVKWWNTDINASIGHDIQNSNYPGYAYHTKAWNAYFTINNSFPLPKKIKAELSIYISTPTRSGIAKVAGAVNLSAGIQKPIIKEKAALKLNFANFIGPTQSNELYKNEKLYIKWINQWEGKRISLSFNYKFGNSNVKSSRQRKTASQEEGNRVNL